MEERTLLTSFCEIITVGGLSPLVIATLCWLTAAFVCVAVWKAVASAQNVAEVPFGSGRASSSSSSSVSGLWVGDIHRVLRSPATPMSTMVPKMMVLTKMFVPASWQD